MPKSLLVSTGASTSITADYKFLPFGSCNIKTTHANTNEIYSAVTVKENFTVSNLYFRVNTNTRDVSTATCAFRLNGADSSLACSIPAATTGWFYDTTSRINVVSDDTCNFVIRYGSGGTGSFTFDTIMAVIDKTGYDTISYLSMVESNDYTGTAFTSLSGSNFNLSTESPTQTLLPQGVIKDHNLYTTQSRDADCSGFIRKNSTSFLPLTITASTNGYYSNFTDKVYINNNDKVNYYIQRYGTTGALSVKSHNSCFLSYTNQFPMIADTTSDLTITASSEFFYMASGKSNVYTASDTSSRISIPISGLKVSQFKLNITTNTVNNTTPIYVRRNGADTGVSITVPSSTTGTFYNDTSSQVYYKDDTVNIRIASTGTSGALGLKTTTIVWENILSSSAWYDIDWKCRSEIEIDATYVNEAVPVIPIYLSKLDENWWNHVESDGKDIIITQNDGTSVLNYYLVSIDKVNKKGLLIANVDGYIDTTSNVKLVIYCGNSSAVSSSNSALTFSDYAGFYLPGMTTVNLANPGTHNLTAVNTPGTAASGFEGLTAATYDGSSQYHYGTSPLSATATMTLEGLAYADNDTHLGTVVAVGSTSSAQPLGILSLDGVSIGNPARGLNRGDTGSVSIAYSATGFSATTWTYVSETRNGTSGSTIAYISGGNSGSNATTITNATTNSVSIGVLRSNTVSGYLDGNVAMAAVSSTARSANYFSTMHDAWNTTNFRQYGSSEILESWYNSSWTTREKITIDSTYVDEEVPIIPIYLSSLDKTWWDNVESDGKDIRITQDDGITLRDYYLVSIDTTAKTGLLIVNVSGYISVDVNKNLYLYCGNSSAVAVSTSNTFNDTGYVHMWFPGVNGTDVIGSADMTGFNTPGTVDATGYDIKAATYATNKYHLTEGPFSVSTWPLTSEVIGYTTSATANQCLFSVNSTSGSSNLLLLRFRGDLTSPRTDPIEGVFSGFGGGTSTVDSPISYSTNTYYHVMGTRAEPSSYGTSYLYINGGDVSSNYQTFNAWNSLTKASFGAFVYTSTINYLSGGALYGSISNVGRSANFASTISDAWKTASFRTYSSSEKLTDWYSNKWTKRATITIDSTYVDEAVPVIPVYLSGLDDTWWSNVATDGKDIRITQDDGTTRRDYYLVSIDTTAKTGLLMINVDGYISTSVNKDLYIYCGNASAIASSSQTTFVDTGYVGVYFPGVSLNDAVSTRNLTAVGTPGTTSSAAYEVNAATYDGSSQYHYYTGTMGVTTYPFSLECIGTKTNDTSSYQTFFALTNSASSVGVNDARIVPRASHSRLYVFVDDSAATSSQTNFYPVTFGSPQYTVLTRNAATGTTNAYLNGSLLSDTTTLTTLTVNTLSIGASKNATLSAYLSGNVVFTAISNEVRSSNYVSTMLDAWNTAGFRTYSATEDVSGSSGNQYQYQRINMFFFFN